MMGPLTQHVSTASLLKAARGNVMLGIKKFCKQNHVSFMARSLPVITVTAVAAALSLLNPVLAQDNTGSQGSGGWRSDTGTDTKNVTALEEILVTAQ